MLLKKGEFNLKIMIQINSNIPQSTVLDSLGGRTYYL